MSAVPAYAFSCDSPLGCLAHAVVAGDRVDVARDTLNEVLHWRSAAGEDFCPEHAAS